MEELAKEFGKIYTLLFKNYSKNHTLDELINYHNKIGKDGDLITYGEALDIFESICENDKIMKLIKDLKDRIKPIENYKFEIGYESKHELLPIEYRLNTIMLRSSLKQIQYNVSIKNASLLTGIPETTIKQACQQERLLNTLKTSNTWIVNLNEIAEYWGLQNNN